MRRILGLCGLVGCAEGAPTAPAAPSSEARAWVGWERAGLFDGQPSGVAFDATDCAGCEVRVYATTALSTGPCFAGWCLQMGPSARVVARLPVRRGAAAGPVYLGGLAVAGQTLFLQAMVFSAGQPVFRTPWRREVVRPTVEGCTFPGDPTWAPDVTLDDGSCTCAERLTVSTAAELAAAAACSGVLGYQLQAFADPTAIVPGAPRYVFVDGALTELSLPDAADLAVLDVADAPSLAAITAPALTAAGRLSLTDLPALATLDLPLLADVDALTVATTGLPSLNLPALAAAGELVLDANPALHTVDLPALAAWDTASLTENPQWCVAAPFDAPPPGATVAAAGNLCDP